MTGPESVIVPSRSNSTAVGCSGSSDVGAEAVACRVNSLPVLGGGGLHPASHGPVLGYCDPHNSIRRPPVAGESRRRAGAEGARSSRNLSGTPTAAARQLWKAAQARSPTVQASTLAKSLRSRDRAGRTVPAPTLESMPMSSSPAAATFADRHIGPRPDDTRAMLAYLGHADWQPLLESVPPDIRHERPLDLPAPRSEPEVLARLRELEAKNVRRRQMIGQGFHDTHTPPVIRRNVLESPAWYTAYTPYQPEISQGRLEALLNFQTAVSDLTGLPITGASLLDESTAAAEAMTLARRATKVKSNVFVVDSDIFPQTLQVLRTRAEPLGIEVVVADLSKGLPEGEAFGVLVQYPTSSGEVRDPSETITAAHDRGALAVVAADILALTLLRSPGDLGADIAVGSTQRLGVPLGFGGPHAGYMSVGEKLRRQLPGRLVGVSVDNAGRPAYRLALQTREQHIRREKATSNICTAQVLLAVMAGMYAVHHGPDGLRAIARQVHTHTAALADALTDRGFEVVNKAFFDTLRVRVPSSAQVVESALERGYNLLSVDGRTVGISIDETTTAADLEQVVAAFGEADRAAVKTAPVVNESADRVPGPLARGVDYLTHPVFNTHRSETALLRYMRRLADRDLALDRTMIPLGSCTMKLNSTTEMEPITWPEFGSLHPFAPLDQAGGSVQIVRDLEAWLAEVTGYDAVSLQPNAGSQGELAGLLAIRGYHRSRGQAHRDVCLIPSSAHGTNAASAVMAGTIGRASCTET